MHGSTPKKIQKLHFNCNIAIKKTTKKNMTGKNKNVSSRHSVPVAASASSCYPLPNQ